MPSCPLPDQSKWETGRVLTRICCPPTWWPLPATTLLSPSDPWHLYPTNRYSFSPEPRPCGIPISWEPRVWKAFTTAQDFVKDFPGTLALKPETGQFSTLKVGGAARPWWASRLCLRANPSGRDSEPGAPALGFPALPEYGHSCLMSPREPGCQQVGPGARGAHPHPCNASPAPAPSRTGPAW